jgi:hypothetical protein
MKEKIKKDLKEVYEFWTTPQPREILFKSSPFRKEYVIAWIVCSVIGMLLISPLIWLGAYSDMRKEKAIKTLASDESSKEDKIRAKLYLNRFYHYHDDCED